MYVNPFWFGVLVTIIVEIFGCIVYAALSTRKGGKR
jgi:hypothetical protein